MVQFKDFYNKRLQWFLFQNLTQVGDSFCSNFQEDQVFPPQVQQCELHLYVVQNNKLNFFKILCICILCILMQ